MTKKNEVVELKGQQIQNPYKAAAVVGEGNENALIAAEAQRSMIEVMTQFEVAKRFPRVPAIAAEKILSECSRPTLAELATYSFPRGKETIEGPTIRLMEAIARSWGNIRFGWKVIDTNKTRSLIRAFAFDLEANIDRSTEFEVKHWRDTKQGGYALKDERDIYELCANQAMRRVRGCIEGLIPRDVIDMALEACEETSKTNVDVSEAGIKKLLAAFSAFGVNRAMIEALFSGLKMEAMKAPQIVSLRKKYASLKDGMAKAEDFFDVSLADKPKEKEPEKGQPDLKEEVKKAQESQPKDAAKTPENPAENPDDTFPGDRPSPSAKGQGKLV